MPRKPGSTLSKPKRPAGAGARRPAGSGSSAADLGHVDAEFDGTLASAKTATERRRSKLMELELLVRQGELIRRAEVDRHSFATARTLRNRVMGIAPRVAAEVFAAGSVGDCQRILDRELRLALEVIAGGIKHADA